jgi:DNA topoisomerase I
MASLRYVESFDSGYTRERRGQGWRYLQADGRPVMSARLKARLDAIALPPAYRDAWYCAYSNGHIQATGVDDRGRLQYRYHADFRAKQDAEKYGRCASFGAALPAIRKQIALDLARRDMSRERIVAAVVHLLDVGKIRVGNQSYAAANKSFGATTLRNRHVEIRGERVTLSFIGKSGKAQHVAISDRRLASIVKRCQAVPGQELFQFIDDDGSRRAITSTDINDYLRAHSEGYTAKDFRTWGASVIAFKALVGAGGQLSLKDMLAEVSDQLGNTPAIARKSYVHPAIIEAAQRRGGAQLPAKIPRDRKYMSGAELALLDFIGRYNSDEE